MRSHFPDFRRYFPNCVGADTSRPVTRDGNRNGESGFLPTVPMDHFERMFGSPSNEPIPGAGKDHRRAFKFERAPEHQAISPEPGARQRAPHDFERSLVVISHPPHRANRDSQELFTVNAQDAPSTKRREIVAAMSKTQIIDSTTQSVFGAVRACRSVHRVFQQARLLARAVTLSVVTAMLLSLLGCLSGVFAIWFWRHDESHERPSSEVNAGIRGRSAPHGQAPPKECSCLIYTLVDAQSPENDPNVNLPALRSESAFRQKASSVGRRRRRFVEPSRRAKLSDPVLLPSPLEIPQKLAFSVAMWGVDLSLIEKATMHKPEFSKKPGWFKSAFRAAFANPPKSHNTQGLRPTNSGN
jgi:hypothetical protein